MRSRSYYWYGVMAFALLLLPLLAACGGDDGASDSEADTATASEAASDSGQAVQVDFAPEIGTIDNWYNGDATSLTALRGQPVLLVFWADY